jgi:nitrite transporter NirC
MYKDDLELVGRAAVNKVSILHTNPMAYIMSAFLAGVFVGLGCIFMGVTASYLDAAGSAYTKLISGLVFSIGLCCITAAGAELFTGNNFVMTIGSLERKVPWKNTIKLWLVCYLGNLLGSVLLALIFRLTDISMSAPVNAFFVNAAIAKVTASPVSLLTKGILCNLLVCLAVWCSFRLKSEVAKLLMNFCCITAFVACGFEHSVGNMTFITIAMLSQTASEITLLGFIYNLSIVTVGNIIGGALLTACPYFLTKTK